LHQQADWAFFGAIVMSDPKGICRDRWHQKTRVPRLLYGIVCTILRLVILVQYRHVADGRMDIWWQHRPR